MPQSFGSAQTLQRVYQPPRFSQLVGLSVQHHVSGRAGRLTALKHATPVTYLTLRPAYCTEIPVLLKTAAGFAAALKAAPATVAKGLLGSGLKAAASLQGLVAKLSPLLAGNKPLQVWGRCSATAARLP